MRTTSCQKRAQSWQGNRFSSFAFLWMIGDKLNGMVFAAFVVVGIQIPILVVIWLMGDLRS